MSAHFPLQAGFTPVVLGSGIASAASAWSSTATSTSTATTTILDSDAELCALKELASTTAWFATGAGLPPRRQVGFNSPLDLLRFRALSFPDRIRTGLGAAYITKIKKHGLDLDDVYACDWLRRIFGPKIYAHIWEPLLRAKFGDRINTVPAYWVWNTLQSLEISSIDSARGVTVIRSN